MAEDTDAETDPGLAVTEAQIAASAALVDGFARSWGCRCDRRGMCGALRESPATSHEDCGRGDDDGRIWPWSGFLDAFKLSLLQNIHQPDQNSSSFIFSCWRRGGPCSYRHSTLSIFPEDLGQSPNQGCCQSVLYRLYFRVIDNPVFSLLLLLETPMIRKASSNLLVISPLHLDRRRRSDIVDRHIASQHQSYHILRLGVDDADLTDGHSSP